VYKIYEFEAKFWFSSKKKTWLSSKLLKLTFKQKLEEKKEAGGCNIFYWSVLLNDGVLYERGIRSYKTPSIKNGSYCCQFDLNFSTLWFPRPTLTNPYSSRNSTDQQSAGKRNKRDKTQVDTDARDDTDDQITAETDTKEGTSREAEQPPKNKLRNSLWKSAELNAIINRLTKEVDTLNWCRTPLPTY